MRTRPPKTSEQRFRARLWILHLLWVTKGTLSDLNRQLVREPGGRKFSLGVAPRPVATTANDIFGRILALGTDPDGNYSGPVGKKYNLAERVERHLPGSIGWLLGSVSPYLQASPPTLEQAAQIFESSSRALGLQAVDPFALAFGYSNFPELVESCAGRQIQELERSTSPHALSLLLVLYHEACWVDRDSPKSTRIREAVDTWLEEVVKHPLFHTHPIGIEVQQDILLGIHNACARIYREGHRMPSGPRPLWLIHSQPIIFYPTRIDIRDAEFCASLGYATPLSQFTEPRFTPYSASPLPSTEASSLAFHDVLKAAAQLKIV